MQSTRSYTTYNPAIDDDTIPLRAYPSSPRHRSRPPHRRPAAPKVAPVSPRRKHGQALRWNPGVVFAWSTVFSLVMLYIFLNAVALATAFRGRQLDAEISEVQNDLHREYSRIAVITSPDQARQIAQTRGLQKVTPDLIDDLTRVPENSLAANPSPAGAIVISAHQSKRNSRDLVQFVLAPPVHP